MYAAICIIIETIPCARRARLFGDREMTRVYLNIEYVIDFILALVGEIIISPLLAGIAIAITAEDGGNVLLRQLRKGWYGKKVICDKFR